MISINKKKFLSWLFTLLLGFFLGWLLFHNECPENSTVKIERHTDTVTVYKEIEILSPATIKYVTLKPGNQSGNASNVPASELTEVAHWDTSTAEGFKADINYYTKYKFFKNKFSLPVKTITNETTIEREKVITKFPAYEFNAGGRLAYQEDAFNLMPFIALSANQKIFFINYKLQLRTLADLNVNGLKIIPEFEAMLNIPFD